MTLEAFHAAKPVVTCTDSGGPNELVEEGASGHVVDPTPEALGAAMGRLWAHRERARDMGRTGRESLARHRIDWDHCVDRFLAAA